ncbi:MAG: FAD-dependent oxidoreductase [Candidatus Poribacteria bacterium]|nr:FAD-dependent oxidoreductase [Candidatus Poribacteria bacterium]
MQTPHPKFPHLFRPIAMKNVTLPNRIAISAHFAGWWVTDGLPNEDFAAYIEERAKGGVGLFVIGATGPTYDAGPDWMHNTSDAIIPRYRMLAEAGHRHGTKVFAQLIHTRDPIPEPPDDRIRIGMQAQVVPRSRQRPRRPDRSGAELQALSRKFGEAAARAKAGGIDGLELHAHEGFLHSQFLSPIRNQRTDAYGGSLVNRMRFVVETLQAMRDAIGDEMPLGVRLKADDQEAGGMTVEDYIELVVRLEAMGLVDYISLTAGDGGLHHGPMTRPDGEWLSFVNQIKQATDLPIMHAGRITTPEMAEAALADGMMDVVCMTKTHIADPHFTRKVHQGRLADIRYCTRCLQSCIGNSAQMTCVYNPVTSREQTWAELQPAKHRKRVVIVGAGPAGMEAALVAHARGHEVIMLEKSGRVGGQVRLAASSPMRRMFIRIAEFYERQAEKGEFDVHLSSEATIDSIRALKPDAVVIATGSTPRDVRVPGGREAWTVSHGLTCNLDGIEKMLVVDRTGTMHALMLTDYLSDLGIGVEYITPASRAADAVEGMTREEMLSRLLGRGVRFFEEEDLVYWDDRYALSRHNRLVEERILKEIDAVVVSAGAEPLNELALDLRGVVPAVHTIGDANTPRTVYEATLGGGLVGRML